jgi:hypothetical protein
LLNPPYFSLFWICMRARRRYPKPRVVKKPFNYENHQSPKKKMQKNEKTKSRVGSIFEPTFLSTHIIKNLFNHDPTHKSVFGGAKTAITRKTLKEKAKEPKTNVGFFLTFKTASTFVFIQDVHTRCGTIQGEG